jgi:hypothetical protein
MPALQGEGSSYSLLPRATIPGGRVDRTHHVALLDLRWAHPACHPCAPPPPDAFALGWCSPSDHIVVSGSRSGRRLMAALNRTGNLLDAATAPKPTRRYSRRPRHTAAGTIELPRSDGRTLASRRFRHLCEALEAELGTPLSEVDQNLVRQAAGRRERSPVFRKLKRGRQHQVTAGSAGLPALNLASTSFTRARPCALSDCTRPA